MNAGLQNQMPFILMDVSYIIFLEMKKFQLGPHMNLYIIGFLKKISYNQRGNKICRYE